MALVVVRPSRRVLGRSHIPYPPVGPGRRPLTADRDRGWLRASPSHEASGDPLFRAFRGRYLDEEATPILAPVPGIDLGSYNAGLLDRSASPAIGDTLVRICAESSYRLPQFLLPVLRANLASGGPIDAAVTVLAAWARSAEGTDDEGRPIEQVDARAADLAAAARRQEGDPLAFLADRGLFGDLADD